MEVVMKWAVVKFCVFVLVTAALVWLSYTDVVQVIVPWWGALIFCVAVIVAGAWMRLAAFREGYVEGAVAMAAGVKALCGLKREQPVATNPRVDGEIEEVLAVVKRVERDTWRRTLWWPIARWTEPPAKKEGAR